MNNCGVLERCGRVGAAIRIAAVSVALAGCSAGPAPLDDLVSADETHAYDARIDAQAGDIRAAYLSWRSEETGTPVSALAAADDELPDDGNPFDPRDLWAARRGALLYQAHCVECHGARADGLDDAGELLPGGKDFHNPHIRAAVGMSDSYTAGWFRKIHDGFDAMPPFGGVLTREQIWLTVTYLSTDESIAKGAAR